MKWAIIILLLLQAQLAYGTSCNNFDGAVLNQCNEIISSSLSESDKQQLVNGLAYPSSGTANHSIVTNWNTKINFIEAPEGIEKVSSGNIKDAWLKTISIMPSVISKGKLLTPGTGTIQNAYNYKVEMPSGTQSGDCKTDFSLKKEQASLNVYVNDKLMGNSKLTDYQGSGTLNFKTILTITTDIEAKHYKNFKYCCKKGKKGCLKYCEDCKYDNTETKSSSITLEDYKLAYQHWPVIKPSIKAVDHYLDTYVGILNISKFDAFALSFENSSLSQFDNYYSANLSVPPYNVMTLIANNFSTILSKNINYENSNSTYKFYVANPKNCKLKFYSHFSAWEQDCNLKFDFKPMSIKTDKLQYNPDELIKVELEPKNKLITLNYGNQEIKAKDSIQLKAKKEYNKITASLDERAVDKVIHVKDENAWDFALNFGVFSGVLYFYYVFLKKYLVWF